MKRIVFVLEGFFPEKSAGTERYVLNLARQLMINSWEIHVIIPSKLVVESYIFEGIEVHGILIPDKESRLVLGGVRAPENITEFKRLVENIDPSIIHFHSFGRAFNSYHLRIASRLGKRTVFTSHLAGIFCVKGSLIYMDKKSCNGHVQSHKCVRCYISHRYSKLPSGLFSILLNLVVFSQLYRFINPSLGIVKFRKTELRRLNKYCDATISLSNWASKSYALNDVSNIHTIKQAIEIGNSTKIRSSVKRENIGLLYVGRITEIKGIHLLLDALIELSSHQIQLTVVALVDKQDADYYNRIRSKCSELKDITWYENIDRDQLSEIYSKNDILCIPSIVAEMAPLVVLEALANNLFILGSNIGGIADMIEVGRNGMLFQPGNSSDLKERLSELSDKRTIPQTQFQYLESESYSAHINQHLTLYNKLSK